MRLAITPILGLAMLVSACGDSGDADMGAFGAPYGPVAIPDMRGCAGKGLAGSDDRGSEEGKHWRAT